MGKMSGAQGHRSRNKSYGFITEDSRNIFIWEFRQQNLLSELIVKVENMTASKWTFYWNKLMENKSSFPWKTLWTLTIVA